MKMPPEYWAKTDQELKAAAGNARPPQEAIDLSPINEAMQLLNQTAQSILSLQEALESRLSAYYLPYPVRGLGDGLKETKQQSCQHESMLLDVRNLLVSVAERQESLLKALQV